MSAKEYKTYIYALKEKDGEIRYVGKSDNPNKRFKNHINNYKKDKTHKSSWIKNCQINNIVVEMIILEEVSSLIWESREIFWISQFKNLTNHTIGGEGVSTNRNLLSYQEAAMWVLNSGLNIKSRSQWIKLYKNKMIPNFLCSDPEKYYKESGWNSWSEFLGTNYVCNIKKNRDYKSFIDAFKFARTLNIKSSRDWTIWHKQNNPENIPRYPNTTYKDWVGWDYFLGTPKKKTKEYISFYESSKIIRRLNFKNKNEFHKWIRTKNPCDLKIPRSPNTFYKNKGWKSWGHFLKG